MARYFLHLRDGADELLDPEGDDFSNAEAMQKQVLLSARDVIAGDARLGEINLAQRIDAETDTGVIVHTLEFEDAVAVSRGSSFRTHNPKNANDA
jgi:hypothetical protein